MPIRIFTPEFRDQNRTTAYPFIDQATLRSDTGQQLSESTFIDAAIYVVGLQSGAYLTHITIGTALAKIFIGDAADPERASVEVDFSAPGSVLRLFDAFARPAGILLTTAAEIALLQTWPVGDHTFSPRATEFVASTVTPTPELGVRGLITAAGVVLAGDVWLVGEDGVVVRQDGEQTIRIDIVGEPLFNRKLCQDTGFFLTPNFLRTVNGLTPDEFGDFKIDVSPESAARTVLRVRRADRGLIIEAVGEAL